MKGLLGTPDETIMGKTKAPNPAGLGKANAAPAATLGQAKAPVGAGTSQTQASGTAVSAAKSSQPSKANNPALQGDVKSAAKEVAQNAAINKKGKRRDGSRKTLTLKAQQRPKRDVV